MCRSLILYVYNEINFCPLFTFFPLSLSLSFFLCLSLLYLTQSTSNKRKMNHQQIMSNYEQPNTPLMNEKLPGIDKLPKLEENSTPSPPAPSCSIVDNRGAMIPSSAYLPPPPPPSYNSFNPGMMYQQHMSPPLTPAVSPSSVLFDSMQFKRKFSVDVGPFGFGTNIPHPSSMHDQDAYRRSSCSAVSMDNDCVQQNEHHGSNAYSTAANAAASVRCQQQQQQQQQSDYSFLTSMQHHQHHSFGNPAMTTNTAVTSPASSAANATATSPAGAKTSASSRRGSRAQLSGPNTQHKHACSYPYCTWSFKRYEHLKRHMLVHTGKRPHVCHFPGCGKSFSRSDNFHAHYRTHTKKTNMLQQGGSKKKGGNNNNNSSKNSSNNNNQAAAASAAAAAAAVAAAAAAVSVSSSNSSIPSQQVFDDRTPAYFAKQQQPPAFDMIDMYGHRHSYSEQVCVYLVY